MAEALTALISFAPWVRSEVAIGHGPLSRGHLPYLLQLSKKVNVDIHRSSARKSRRIRAQNLFALGVLAAALACFSRLPFGWYANRT